MSKKDPGEKNPHWRFGFYWMCARIIRGPTPPRNF
uniref:Uncharacterized protein n=1 Tax=Zea mays TaxID=4577 RepID=B4FWR9_MAIZE|nr:unknown [Zea mays]